MASYTTVRKKDPALRRIGTLATLWWAASGAWLILLAWQGKGRYIAEGNTGVSVAGWCHALRQAFDHSAWLPILLGIILLGWLLGGWLWLRALARAKVSYRDAFKDLFCTIRK